MAQTRSKSVYIDQLAGGTQIITRYSTVAVVLYWLIAALLLANIILAWSRGFLTCDQIGVVMGLHKSTGILVLLLSLLRLAWRLAHPAAPYPAGLPAWERALAHATQLGLYGIMMAMPLTGWIMTSGPRAQGPPDPIWYRALAVARLRPQSSRANDRNLACHGEAHGLPAWFPYLLIVLHVAGALKHQFLDKDIIMARMLPVRRPW